MISAWGEPFSAREAVAAGIVTRGQLRWNYRTIYPDVYLPRGTRPVNEY